MTIRTKSNLFTATLLVVFMFTTIISANAVDIVTEPIGGQPAPGAVPSVEDLEYQVAYQRAFEAVVWSMPAVGIYRFREGSLEAFGIGDNDIIAFSTPATPRAELLTANNVTPYIFGFTDLRNGPVVLEIPAKTDEASLYGQVVDAWQVTIADVGPSGEDQGAGGKYLFIPPGYEEPVPSGYFPIQSESYRLGFVFRSIPEPGVPLEVAHAYAQTLKMYPLADAANPSPTRFVDGSTERVPTLPRYDLSAFQDIYDIVSVEPVRPRDKVMMGMLASIGIEPGKPFNPQGKIRTAMENAVVDAYFYMQERRVRLLDAQAFWPDRHWGYALITDAEGGFQYETDDSLQYDQRADMFFPGTFYPRVMPARPATAYLLAGADSEGRRLEAGKNYRLRVPADMPVNQFWALIIYDMATYAFIYNPLSRVGLSSREKSSMQLNADGSVDIYFGPTPPAGLNSNWIPTQGKVPLPLLRFYGPNQAFWDKTFKMPDVELVE
jgi:hypothetical protein